MYLESVASLENVVEKSSETEVGRLRDIILSSNAELISANDELMELFMSVEDPVVTSPVPVYRSKATNLIAAPVSATAEWSNFIRWKSFSRIASSSVIQEVGIDLVPWEPHDPAAQYTHIRYDLKADGTREYFYVRYGQHLSQKKKKSRPNASEMDVVGLSLHGNGSVNEYAYSFPFPTYNWTARYKFPKNGDFGRYTADTDAGDLFVRGEGRAVLKRYRKPEARHASDRNPYVVMAFDQGYMPPAAPHPWSVYKQVWMRTRIIFTFWEEAVARYSTESKDTTLILYDMTTSGQGMIDKTCWQTAAAGSDIAKCVI